MAYIVAESLVNMAEIEAILEDNLPQCELETEYSASEFESTLRVRKATHIGAKISLSAHSLFFNRENVQKLRGSGIADPLLDGIEQGADTAPIEADGLQEYLKMKLKDDRDQHLLKEHKTTIYRVCAINSIITFSDWDPNQFGGLLTGGNAFYISHRCDFVKELVQLLSANIKHSDSEIPSDCFIATAASGNANEQAVLTLRHFRDQRLVQTSVGRSIVRIYETLGPMIARMIKHSYLSRKIIYILCVRPGARIVSTMVDPMTEIDETSQVE